MRTNIISHKSQPSLTASYESLDVTTIQYVMTNKCNLACTYCPKKFLYEESNFSNIDKFLEDLIVFRKNNNQQISMYLSGGEVLTDWPALEYMLKKLSKIKLVNLIIFSNGILLTPTIIRRLNILKAIVDFKLYITIHPSSTGLTKVKYINQISVFAKFYIQKLIIMNKDYLPEFLDNKETFKDYSVLPNMIDTEELIKLKEANIKGEDYYILDGKNIDVIDLYLETNFNFKGWVCSAGKNYFIYNKEKLYRCSSDYHIKKEIGVKLDEYILKETICEHTRCVCEQSLPKWRDYFD